MIRRDAIDASIDWLAGGLLIAIGGYHWLSGGPAIAKWLESIHPALSHQQLTVGRMGFELGGYLAVAIGLSFIIMGRKLPTAYYWLWAAVFLAITALSGLSFGALHVSQLCLVVAIVLAMRGIRLYLFPGLREAQ